MTDVSPVTDKTLIEYLNLVRKTHRRPLPTWIWIGRQEFEYHDGKWYYCNEAKQFQ